jgi:hypothetical protein
MNHSQASVSSVGQDFLSKLDETEKERKSEQKKVFFIKVN